MVFLGAGCYQSPPSSPHVAVQLLIALLADQEAQVRRTAAESLGKIGHAGAEEPLIVALLDSDPFVREAAARALGRLSSSGMEVGQALLPLLHDGNRSVRQAAAQSLGEISDSAGLAPALIDLLKDSRPAVRRSAAHALWLIDSADGAVRKALRQATEDADALVRQWAVAAVGESGGSESASILANRLLHDSSPDVQAEAAYRLRFIGDEAGLKKLEGTGTPARSVEVARWLNHSLASLRAASGSGSGHPPGRPAETGLSRRYP